MGNSAYLDWILAAICFFLAVLFFIGKGQKLLDAFSGKNNKTPKMDEKTNRKYQCGIGVFILILGLMEVGMAVFQTPLMGIISVVVVIIDLVWVVFFIRKVTEKK